MAAFGHQKKCRTLLVPPLPADKHRSEKNRIQRFYVVDINDTANGPLVKEGFDFLIHSMVAEDMANKNRLARFPLRSLDELAILQCRCHRFFQEHVVAFPECFDGSTDVVLIH